MANLILVSKLEKINSMDKLNKSTLATKTIVTVTAHLRDTRDNSLHLYSDSWDWSDGGENDDPTHTAWFAWTQNNKSCDCNRSIFLGANFENMLPCNGDVIVSHCGDDVILLEKLIDDATGRDVLNN